VNRETAALENSTSYFPLLDRIADGTFSELNTEKELYNKFLDVLIEDCHFQDAESLSSFKFALALHSAAPRIEAHFQYYNTSVAPTMMAAQDAVCPVWIHFEGKQYCSPSLERAQQDVPMQGLDINLPFDRVLGAQSDVTSSILYADITHPLFGQFHKSISKTAREGHTSYRLRYRPSSSTSGKPLYVNGYGVELVLKRTDYIVIDDREEGSADKGNSEQTILGDVPDDEPADLKPLTTSELFSLGLNAASFIMGSSDPFETLLKVSANFPRYSSLIASQNTSADFLSEFRSNRAAFLPQGYNVLWINGLQVENRQINAFSLHEHLKRERKLISQLQEIGLSSMEAVNLISHEVIAQAHADDEPQRYDWQDEIEGGGVIMWLNDIEQDKRYSSWPSDLRSLLQRTYPGQLPPVRRDIHNLILPVDLADAKDLEIIVEVLQNLVKRTVPVRIGLVPVLKGPVSVEHAKLAYHILDTHGLGPLITFCQNILLSKSASNAGKSSFSTIRTGSTVRQGREPLTYESVMKSAAIQQILDSVKKYSERLQLAGPNGPFLINGVALPRNENWLDTMSQRITLDLRAVQRGVYENTFPEDTWIPQFFLFKASSQRNALVVPEDLKSVKVVDVGSVVNQHLDLFASLPRIPGLQAGLLSERAHLLLVADLGSEKGLGLLKEALASRQAHPEIELLIVHNPVEGNSNSWVAHQLIAAAKDGKIDLSEDEITSMLDSEAPGGLTEEQNETVRDFWLSKRIVPEILSLAPGQTGLWLNGRVIAPITGDFTASDFEMLYSFEKTQRITAVTTAITALSLEDRFESALDLAKVTSLVARALKSDVPEGIYESAPLIRMDKFNVWNGTHSSIHVSNSNDPTIRIVAAIDPASEVVQHWIPILKTLSELEGVDLQIYLNPRERITELPIKRFYRQVIESAPSFDEQGSLIVPRASFTGIPAEALLNLGMVVPPSWLVAPEECVYDLDNIKLSTLPAGQNVDAIYELEHILIEGHSRDVTKGPPPRGVQLLLGTEQDPHFTDTLIMANLGYFQFKANPGYWHISLKSGRSSKIFHIDSVGAKGYAAQPGDETTSVALLSFQGTTLFPRLSRKPGMENEDVLETTKLGSAMDYLSRGASFASSALSSVGIGKSLSSSSTNAEINIFSVASGHLYERMLNIMMLSVMKHTNHTVKFWFIEQFLSPSFKSFLPHLATHYGFSYEMVTYKWPHWLRGQKEKQREIWGYKILFLDVLFPLSLDKVIFVDADQIVRTDMMELNKVDLHGAPYGFTPMCDDRTEMEGFRFWKTGYWANFLEGKPYHISALYVVDLRRFRELAAGDRLRQQYHALSADPGSLSNLDQDLPNHMQHVLPIHSLSMEWLWCETWCSDESLGKARTIDLCNNPLTKEPKLDRARRQVPEWTKYDEEIAAVRRTWREGGESGRNEGGDGVRKRDEL
jgi:UDP-glucose:glycoprotein glucosyltransferase